MAGLPSFRYRHQRQRRLYSGKRSERAWNSGTGQRSGGGEGRVQNLIQYLLGRVVVADTIDHAIALARKFRHTLRIVTLEGELLSAGGSMTGGSFKNSSNLLGRQRELSELQASCRKALQDVEETPEGNRR